MRELGIFAWFGYELPLRESFRLIRAAGFDRVMLWWGEYEGDIPLKDQPDRARRMGLEIENAHAPFDGCNTLWLPGEDGDRYADSLIACLEGCAETGVPVLVAHLTDEASPPPYHPRGLDRLRRAEEAAERTGVTLALENLRHVPHLRAAMQALASSKVGFCYDSGHHHGWCREEPYLDLYGSRLATLHLHDNNQSWDTHRLPFDGTTDWPAAARQIAATGFSGAVSLEVQAYGYYEERMTAEAFLQQAYTAADRIRRFMNKQ
ncbi:MAG: sugar phosphate isomerase/epimerase [Clostridiales bacterium]|nr:sugar phosphate isomerase/epimerase [Clostridiales bacterium]